MEKDLNDITRRLFLSRSATGIGTLALASLLEPAAFADAPKKGEHWRGVVQKLDYKPRIKRVIHLYMAGGPSHLETFDFKPKLREMHGKPMPDSFTKGQQIAQLQGSKLVCYGGQHDFVKAGKNGQEISSIFPQLAKVADELCIVRSMNSDQINHDPAHTLMNTGSPFSGRPSMGSWLLYGLGSVTEDLPGYVVLTSAGRGGQMQPIAARQWSAGFIPGRFQGVHLRSKGEPVLYLDNPEKVERTEERHLLNAIRSLNEDRFKATQDPEILTRIAQYEMAFRMQTSVPGLMDVSQEKPETLEMYGAKPGDGSFASNCLLARRLAEKGVRFIQLYHRDWDHHGNLKHDIALKGEEVDRACWALITDLKQRGMLEDTLILWGGEFGRTPMAQGDGRDHHIKGYSIWMAGGGVKGGTTYGATDDLGYAAAENPFHTHDLHATMLYLFGIEHTKLTYRFQGRDYRLTDVFGNVAKGVVA